MGFLRKFFGTPKRAVGLDGRPDFSDVTSGEILQALVKAGELIPIYLFPLELGGDEVEQNKSHIPPEALPRWNKHIGRLSRLQAENLFDNLTIAPDYRGESLVPIRLNIIAYDSADETAEITAFEIW